MSQPTHPTRMRLRIALLLLLACCLLGVAFTIAPPAAHAQTLVTPASCTTYLEKSVAVGSYGYLRIYDDTSCGPQIYAAFVSNSNKWSFMQIWIEDNTTGYTQTTYSSSWVAGKYWYTPSFNGSHDTYHAYADIDGVTANTGNWTA